jgi:Wings apart-like protein regulation of heterochromatin
MSSLKRHRDTRVVTYSRKPSGKVSGKVSGSKITLRTNKKLDETNRGFWDFLDSSDDEEVPAEESALQPSPVTPDRQLKRKTVGVVGESLGKKEVVEGRKRSRSSTPVDIRRRVKQTTEADSKLQYPKAITPRMSNLISSSDVKSTSSTPSNSRSRTPQPQFTPPRPSTPRSKTDVQTSTPPRTSPNPSTTPTKRTLARVHSSPLSTPPSSQNLTSQPLPTTPRTASRLSTPSRSLNDFSSPKMTPKQEKTWESLPITDTSSPSRRRLVDKLREEASRTTPEKTHTPPPISTITFSIEDEISRILEYKIPTFEEPRPPPRKDLSQSDSQGTYLSRSRSILADPSVQESLIFEELWQPEEPSQQINDEEEDSGVKSWHELKRGGEDKRLLDEMEDLIEECKVDGRLGLRRSSVLQIVQKLSNDVTWRRKFKALGLMSNFIQNVEDAYIDPVLFLFWYFS